MLQAPVSDKKTKPEASRSEGERESERLQGLTGWGERSALGVGQSPVTATQQAFGNQAALRMVQAQQQKSPSMNPVHGGVLQRKCACGNASSAAGTCAECHQKQELSLQTKLRISEPGDRYEQEADLVADQIVATSSPDVANNAPLYIQRDVRQPTEGAETAPVSVNHVLSSPGRPLELKLRQDMEQRFGYDFSRVRVHSGMAAEQSVQDVNAYAYTVGSHIVFGAGMYTPETQEGKRLIAHELTHVIQQSGAYESRQGIVQRVTTRGAGGCSAPSEIDEDEEGARAAGRAAHRQIQAFLLPTIRSEVEIPRGTKRQKASTGCQPNTTNAGFADLLRMSGIVVDIGEIKPFPSAAPYGVEDVEHYIRRSNQSMDRQFGLGVECPGMSPGTDDALFARTVHAGRMVPRAFSKMTGVLGGDTVIGAFDGDPSRTLKARLAAPGAVGYWCTGGSSDTYTCGVSQEETRAYIDRALTPAQEVLNRMLEEQIERPLARMLQRLTVRQLLEIGERHMGAQIREALRPHLGPFADQVLNQVNARQLGDFIDQNLGPAAASIATTLARRFASRMINELRISLRNILAEMIRDTLTTLCVGAPVVTLVQLLDELKRQLQQQARQLIPVVATAVALAMVAEVADMIRQAAADFANAILRVLAIFALVVLAVAIIVVGIIFIISVFDPLPGDEVAIGAAEAFLINLLRSVAQFAFAVAESGSTIPATVLVEAETGKSDVGEENEEVMS